MSAEAANTLEDDEETQVQSAAIVLKLRGLGISDRAVLKAIETVPRPLFVRERAANTTPIPTMRCRSIAGR